MAHGPLVPGSSPPGIKRKSKDCCVVLSWEVHPSCQMVEKRNETKSSPFAAWPMLTQHMPRSEKLDIDLESPSLAKAIEITANACDRRAAMRCQNA
eukprot:3020622-Amphidinium_carterae.1